MDINLEDIVPLPMESDLKLEENSSEVSSRTIPGFETLSTNLTNKRKRKMSADSNSNLKTCPTEEHYALADNSHGGTMPGVKSGFLDTSTLIKKTAEKKELNTLRVQIAMISDLDGDRPIHVAVAQEDYKLVKKLCALMLKATISLDLTNYLRQTPLHLAVMLGNKQLAILLLECGARITLRDRRGRSVLHLAMKSDAKKEILNLILKHPDTKQIINLLDYEGYSALHYAVVRSNKAAIRCFHREGAEMNVTDGKSGRSPLIHAILGQNVEMVCLLLECGAVPEIVDYSGRSAFEFALYSTNKRIINLVERHMLPTDSETQVPVVDIKDIDAIASDNSALNRSERTSARPKRSCNRKRKDTL